MVLAVPIGDFAGQLVDPASGTGRAAVVVVGAIIQAAGGEGTKTARIAARHVVV
jgi:hypothetical protein